MRLKTAQGKPFGRLLFIAIGSLCLYSFLALHHTGIAMGQTQQKANENKKGSENMKSISDEKESPFFCNMNALTVDQRKRVIELVKLLKTKTQEVKELPNGFAFRYKPDSEIVRDAAEFITYERLCCPFFEFELAVEREGGPLWLRLKGREGVKDFIRIEFEL
jgi:hypothetical protein